MGILSEVLTLCICSGRTGRKGNTGTSYTLFTPNNGPKARDLIQVLTEAKQVVNPKLQELTAGGFRGRGGGGGRYGGGGGGGGRYGGGGRLVYYLLSIFITCNFRGFYFQPGLGVVFILERTLLSDWP